MGEKLFFPLFFDLSEKTVLVAGGGPIAERRVKALLPFAGHIIVTAPECTDALAQLAGEGKIERRVRRLEPADLDGAALALAATGDAGADGEIRRLCSGRGILANIASDKDQCDFYFPGVARKGPLVAGVTAGGMDHKKARELTEKIRELLKNE